MTDKEKIRRLEQRVTELEAELAKSKRNQEKILEVLENNQEQIRVLRERSFNDGNHNN